LVTSTYLGYLIGTCA